MVLSTEIILLVVFLVLSGFFSGSEIALVSLSRPKAKQMFENKRLGASFIKKLKDNPHRMLSTVLIGNNVVNIAAAAVMTSIAIGIFKSHAVAIATGIMTLFILVFGEIIPKSIAVSNNESISQLVAAPIWYLSIVFFPIINILDWFIRLIGIRPKKKVISEEEIISIIKTAEEEGSIKEIEKKMINRIFKFDDISVSEIATPRADMVMIDSKSDVNNAMKLILKKKFSRMPVYEKSKDNIVGIIYLKDLIKYVADKNKNISVSKIMKKPYFVPETKKISSLLRHFQKRKEQMAIVVDEHGSITGLVTLEDVLEEIVGEIMDETDKISPNIKRAGKNIWVVNGKTDIEEINEKINMGIKEEGYDTFSGFILNYTGKIPKEDDEIIYDKFKMKIEEIEGHRISKVVVEKIG